MAGGHGGSDKKHRRPLLQRAAWHALKHLIRKHPGVALGTAASGASYAAKEIAHEGTEAVRDGIKAVTASLTGHRDATSEQEAKEHAQTVMDEPATIEARTAAGSFLDHMNADQREAVMQLVRRSSKKG
ncbi:hypothetical protein [Terrihabitans sp. B22-R8]|uniref:hypothetical protein n=1 Tax=Terrihabitans sp. B22-R8 TaxID=3425128 RepID=UPI00403D048A